MDMVTYISNNPQMDSFDLESQELWRLTKMSQMSPRNSILRSKLKRNGKYDAPYIPVV